MNITKLLALYYRGFLLLHVIVLFSLDFVRGRDLNPRHISHRTRQQGGYMLYFPFIRPLTNLLYTAPRGLSTPFCHFRHITQMRAASSAGSFVYSAVFAIRISAGSVKSAGLIAFASLRRHRTPPAECLARCGARFCSEGGGVVPCSVWKTLRALFLPYSRGVVHGSTPWHCPV